MQSDKKQFMSPIYQSLHSHKLQAVIVNFYSKLAQVVIQNRLTRPSLQSTSKKINKWFDLEFPELTVVKEETKYWRLACVSSPSPPPMIIECFLDASELSHDEKLAIFVNSYQKYVLPTANMPMAHGDTKGNNKTSVLLESWSIHFSPCFARQSKDLTLLYKICVNFFQTLVQQVTTLPAFKLFNDLRKNSKLKIGYRLVATPSQLATEYGFDQQLFNEERPKHSIQMRKLGSIETDVGIIAVSVAFRTCNDFVIESWSTPDLAILDIDETYFMPKHPEASSAVNDNSFTSANCEESSESMTKAKDIKYRSYTTPLYTPMFTPPTKGSLLSFNMSPPPFSSAAAVRKVTSNQAKLENSNNWEQSRSKFGFSSCGQEEIDCERKEEDNYKASGPLISRPTYSYSSLTQPSPPVVSLLQEKTISPRPLSLKVSSSTYGLSPSSLNNSRISIGSSVGSSKGTIEDQSRQQKGIDMALDPRELQRRESEFHSRKTSLRGIQHRSFSNESGDDDIANFFRLIDSTQSLKRTGSKELTSGSNPSSSVESTTSVSSFNRNRIALAKFQQLKRSHSALSDSIYSSSLPKASELLQSSQTINNPERKTQEIKSDNSTSNITYAIDHFQKKLGENLIVTSEFSSLSGSDNAEETMLFAMSGLSMNDKDRKI